MLVWPLHSGFCPEPALSSDSTAVGWSGQGFSSDAQSSYVLGQASCLDHAVRPWTATFLCPDNTFRLCVSHCVQCLISEPGQLSTSKWQPGWLKSLAAAFDRSDWPVSQLWQKLKYSVLWSADTWCHMRPTMQIVSKNVGRYPAEEISEICPTMQRYCY